MFLIVGLGNPGREYVGTRHNVGFDLIDRLAWRMGWTFGLGEFDRLARSKFDGLTMDGPAGQDKALLLKPMTYMNLSGKSVQQAMAFYQLTPSHIMVVLDDVALPCGKLRIRPAGSSGGHNGLRDIERCLGTDKYPRLRVGVDPPPSRVPQRDWVLGKFFEHQQKEIESALSRASDALLLWMEKGIEAAMNKFNAAEEKKQSGRDSDREPAKRSAPTDQNPS